MTTLSLNEKISLLKNKQIKNVQIKKYNCLLKDKIYPLTLDEDYCPKCVKKLTHVAKQNSQATKKLILFCFHCNELFESNDVKYYNEEDYPKRKGCYSCGSALSYNGLKKVKWHYKDYEYFYDIETVVCETCRTIYPL